MVAMDPFDTGQLLYETELKALHYASEGHGVLSGCEPTENGGGADRSVDVAAGYCVDSAGALVTVSQTNVAIDAAHATLDRIDIIYIDTTDDTPKEVAGTASANPNPPDLPDQADILIARVHVGATVTILNDSDIYDCRALLYGNQAVHTASDWKIHNSGDFYLYSDYNSTNTFLVDGGTGDVTMAGDLTVTGNNISDSGGTVMTFNGSQKTTFAGDVTLDLDTKARFEFTTTSNLPYLKMTNVSGDSSSGYLQLGKARGTVIGSPSIVNDNDELGRIYFTGWDGNSNYAIGAGVWARVNGTPGTGDMPGELILGTTPDSQSTPSFGMIIDSSQNTVFYGNVEPDTDGANNLGGDGIKWATAYYDAADTSDPTAWNDQDCLSMLIDPDMWLDRPKDSPYYISKITNTIQLDPSTCPIEMQDIHMHRTLYQEWVDNGKKGKQPNRNPDDPNYDPQDIGLLINDLVTFNAKCLREIYPKYLELKKEVEELKAKLS